MKGAAHLVETELAKVESEIETITAQITKYQDQRIQGGKIESLRRKLEGLEFRRKKMTERADA